MVVDTGMLREESVGIREVNATHGRKAVGGAPVGIEVGVEGAARQGNRAETQLGAGRARHADLESVKVAHGEGVEGIGDVSVEYIVPARIPAADSGGIVVV